MIDLYAMGSPNVVKIFIALEELGLAYRAHPVDLGKGEQFTPAFTALSPTQKVPVILDQDGPDGAPITVFESGAILLYLADKTGRLLPQDARGRTEALQWLMVQLTGVGPMFGQAVHFLRFAPAGNDYGKSRYQTQMLRICDVLDRRLQASAFLGGADYSIADVSTFPWIRMLETFQPGTRGRYEALAAWHDRIAARPAVERALVEVAKVTTQLKPLPQADPAMLDRIFGRGDHARN